jgi:glycosyltransferase involved in cell wall biosynthesis
MMAKKKIVSVIIGYNHDRGWLNEAIESVKNAQIYDKKLIEVELIIVHGKNNNIAENLNIGIQAAKGQYIKYLSEDDLLTPNCIEDSLNAFTNDIDFIHGNSINFHKNGKMELYKPRHTVFDLKSFLQVLQTKTNFIHGGTLMFRKSFFTKVGLFDTTLKCAEEHELVLRGLSMGMKIGYCNKTLYKYRRHDKQKSLGKGVDQAERMRIVKEIHTKFRLLC